MACALGLEGGQQLVVRNTFLELFDDTPALGLAEGGRRPRAQTDLADYSKLPQKVPYAAQYAAEEGNTGPGCDTGGTQGPQIGAFPGMTQDEIRAPHANQLWGPGAGFPLAPYPGFDEYSAAMASMGASWWELATTAAMPPYAGSQPAGFPPWGAPQGYPAAATATGERAQPSATVQQVGQKERKAKGARAEKPQQGAQAGVTAGAELSAVGSAVSKGGNSKVAQTSPVAAPSVATSTGTSTDDPSDTDNATTIMLRNIPNRYTQTMLLTLLEEKGFKSRFDFVYLPMDFRNGVNLGYAFVNVHTHEDALTLMDLFHGFSAWFFDSAKVCEVSWAHPHQGLQQHVERYRNSPVMHPCMPDEYKPMIFKDGERLLFPPPTKAIRAPKLRPVRDRGDKAGAEA